MPETIMNLTSGRAPRLTDPFTDSLLLICRLLVCRGEGRLRLAYAEKDETMVLVADHHLPSARSLGGG